MMCDWIDWLETSFRGYISICFLVADMHYWGSAGMGSCIVESDIRNNQTELELAAGDFHF